MEKKVKVNLGVEVEKGKDVELKGYLGSDSVEGLEEGTLRLGTLILLEGEDGKQYQFNARQVYSIDVIEEEEELEFGETFSMENGVHYGYSYPEEEEVEEDDEDECYDCDFGCDDDCSYDEDEYDEYDSDDEYYEPETEEERNERILSNYSDDMRKIMSLAWKNPMLKGMLLGSLDSGNMGVNPMANGLMANNANALLEAWKTDGDTLMEGTADEFLIWMYQFGVGIATPISLSQFKMMAKAMGVALD